MNKMACILALAGALFCGSCADSTRELNRSVAKEQRSAPLLTVKNWPAAPAFINGADAKPFIIDTAAGVTVVDTEWATELSLPKANQGLVAGANGMSLLSLGTVETLRVADRTIENLRVVLIDTDVFHPGVGGIIGNDILSRYTTTIDMPRGVFEFADDNSALDLNACIPNMMPERSTAKAGFMFAPVTKTGPDGSSLTGIVDSGAAQTVLNWKAAEAIGIARDDPSLTLFAKGTGGLDKKAGKVTTYLKTVQGLRIGDWDIPEAQVRIADLPIFKVVGIDDVPSVIIGSDILKQRRYTITKGSHHFCWRGSVPS